MILDHTRSNIDIDMLLLDTFWYHAIKCVPNLKFLTKFDYQSLH